MTRKRKLVSFMAMTVFLSQLLGVFSWGTSSLPIALAAPVCTTREACEQMMQDQNTIIEDLKQQEAEVQAELDVVDNDMEATLIRIEASEAKVRELQANIQALQKQIGEISDEIALNEAELEKINVEIADLEEIIGLRMRVTQQTMRNNPFLAAVSEATSLADLLRQMRVMNAFAEEDADLMDQLNVLFDRQQQILQTLQDQKAELESQQAELEEQKSVLDLEITALEADRALLAKQQAELGARIADLGAQQMSAQEVANIAREAKELLDRVQQGGGGNSTIGSGVSGGGRFIIPLERGRVTCEFGCYTSPFFHNGIDLGNGGDTSTRVLAAADGVVVRSGWHNSFGNHVIITHNFDGEIFTTVYAHMFQTPFVSVGQSVAQGQVLGTMGNTGNSFGAHLHFEIYVGHFNWPNSRNPRDFINFPSSW